MNEQVKIHTIVIPGLAMAADQIPSREGRLVLENPDVGLGPVWKHDYTLQDIAHFHAEKIKTLKLSSDQDLLLVGMSMGGMILAALAAHHFDSMPKKTRLRFLVTSANTRELPAIPPKLMASWLQAKPGDVESFSKILAPFFSPTFLQSQPETVAEFYRYRAFGGNKQSAKGFFRQVHAIQTSPMEACFQKLSKRKCEIIGGAQDLILGPDHFSVLQNILPEAFHLQVSGMGHMVNLERPELISDPV